MCLFDLSYFSPHSKWTNTIHSITTHGIKWTNTIHYITTHGIKWTNTIHSITTHGIKWTNTIHSITMHGIKSLVLWFIFYQWSHVTPQDMSVCSTDQHTTGTDCSCWLPHWTYPTATCKCPMLYLRMHCVMLHSVTNLHQNAFPEEEDCIISVYFQSYPLHLGKWQKICIL